MSSNTTISGDEYHEITANTELSQDYMYAFISNSEMSAGLWSNSENEGSAKRLAYLEEAITQESWQLQKKKTVMYLWGLEVQMVLAQRRTRFERNMASCR